MEGKERLTKLDYNLEPVFYCKKCLSLKIRGVDNVDGTEYCEDCGSTDVGTTDINSWDELYYNTYGFHYLEGNKVIDYKRLKYGRE